MTEKMPVAATASRCLFLGMLLLGSMGIGSLGAKAWRIGISYGKPAWNESCKVRMQYVSSRDSCKKLVINIQGRAGDK